MKENDKLKLALEIDLDNIDVESEEKDEQLKEEIYFFDFIIKGIFYNRDYTVNGCFFLELSGIKRKINDLIIVFKNKLSDDEKNFRVNWKKYKHILEKSVLDIEPEDPLYTKIIERKEQFFSKLDAILIDEWYNLIKNKVNNEDDINVIDDVIKPFFEEIIAIDSPDIEMNIDVKPVSKEYYLSEQEKLETKKKIETNVIKVEPQIDPKNGIAVSDIIKDEYIFIKLVTLKDIENYINISNIADNIDDYILKPYFKAKVYSINKINEEEFKIIVDLEHDFYGAFIESGNLKIKSLYTAKVEKKDNIDNNIVAIIISILIVISVLIILFKYFLF